MTRVLWALAAALVAVGALFFAWPGLDLVVTHWIYDAGGFIGAGVAARGARLFFRVTPFVILANFAIPYLLAKAGVAMPWAPDGRKVWFLALSIAIGPGLIVNLAMKDHLHRPRPIQVLEFGGHDEFRPWYRFDGACKKNCGFPSGEASTGFWMVAPALLVPAPLTAPAVAAAVVFGVATSALRIAFGGHFLSDVLFGGLIALIVVFAVHRVIWPRGRP